MSAVPASSMPHYRSLIAVLVAVAAVMAGGGLVARELYRQPEQPAPAVQELPSTTTRPPSAQPGSGVVELTPDAAAHPEHEVVRKLMQTYFDAINGRDYDAWKTTATRVRVQAKPRAEWQSEYRTTKDGSILIYRIESAPDRTLRVFLAFTSTQDPSAAPRELPEACVRWNLVLPLTQEGGHWRVDAVNGPVAPMVSRC